MDSETASSVDEQPVVAVGNSNQTTSPLVVGPGGDTRGKHRILAQLKRLEQEIKSLQEELEELEKTDNVSTICAELLRNVENIPDALLSVTNGPINPLWDRWFEGPQDAKGCRCWIL